MIDSHLWPKDYFWSRKQFIKFAQACNANIDSHRIKAVGPRGEALFVDVASFVSTRDEHLIVLTSGLHGVEGFIGGYIQSHILQKLAQYGVPDRTGIVMIHAANPWGFAHLRRVDENNIDVNRNFIDFDATIPSSHTQYSALDPVINPRTAPSTVGEIKYWLKAAQRIVRYGGIKNLARPIAQGQYDYPQGLFFGGSYLSTSNALLQKLMLGMSADAERVTILDVHSGLGPSGTATLISNSNIGIDDKRSSWLETHYQLPVVMDNASNNAYNAQGSWSQWCQQAFSDKRFLYLCVEIGTVNPVKLFSALRRENQAHHWSDTNSKPYYQTKKALLAVFAPQSPRWREKSLAQGLHAFERTVALPL